MQTTIRMDDELYREVKSAAARAGATVTAFIEEALRMRLARQQAVTETTELPPVFTGDGLQPGVDLDDSAALLDLLEAD